MRAYSSLFTFLLALLLCGQVLASPALEVSISCHIPLSL